MAQQIIWTAIPQGVTTGPDKKLKLAVFASPRLTVGTTLAQFPDWLDWPDTVSKIRFNVQVGNTLLTSDKITRLQPSGITATSSDPSAAWKSLFPANTPVEPFVFESLVRQPILSYSVRNMLGFVKGQYGRASLSSPTGECLVASLLAPDGLAPIILPSGPRQNPSLAATQRARELLQTRTNAPAVAPPNPTNDFALLRAFHSRQNNLTPGKHAGQPTTFAKNLPSYMAQKLDAPPDFHQKFTALLNHPDLLEWFGIVVNLELPLTALPVTEARLGVEPDWKPKTPASTDSKPLTLAMSGFRPKPRELPGVDGMTGGPEFTAEGLVRLRDGNYDVVGIDVDGAALKLANAGQNLARSALNAAPSTPITAVLPALRSAGLALTRNGRGVQSGLAFQAASDNNKGLTGTVTLYADDLVRGVRADVREMYGIGKFGSWRSLCMRKAQYDFLTIGGKATASDEGVITLSATAKDIGTPDAPQPALGIPESLFRWTGWSLCVPAPLSPTAPTDSGTEPTPPWPMKFSFALDGTLPLLRFGRFYQFRLRTADLAGWSIPATSPDDTQTTSAIDGYYARYEPISAPVMIPRAPLKTSSGESVERLVVRSNYNTASFGTARSERHIAPPKADFTLVSSHGKLDKGDAPDPAAAPLLARLDQDFKAIEPGESVETPYLPDPMAFGVTFVGFSLTTPIVTVPFLNDTTPWHQPKSLRLALQGVKDGPTNAPTPANRVLPVELAQGQMLRLRMSCQLESISSLEILGVWNWARQALNTLPGGTAKVPAFAKLVAEGLHAMITPFREITLVHAVQQPLVSPEFAKLTPDFRRDGDTFVQFEGTLKCEAKTTGKVDVFAEWSEPIDDYTTDHPDTTRRQGRARAWEFPLHFLAADDPTSPLNDPATAKVAPDKKVRAYGSGTDNSKEATAAALLGKTKNPAIGFYAPVQRLLYFNTQDVPEFRGLPHPLHEFGDTKHRRVIYYPVATSRFREYFVTPDTDTTSGARRGGSGGLGFKNTTPKLPTAPRVTRGDDDAERKPITLQIPSTKRPDAPKVRYIVPTFAWQKGTNQSTRRSALRVYLDRPWWSSGDDEMLGVVLWPSPKTEPPAHTGRTIVNPLGRPALSLAFSPDVPDALAPYVTQWARDPLWVSPAVPGLPAHDDFPLAVDAPEGASTVGLYIDEVSDQAVAVAPHKVAFDADRNLWYCDIEIDAGASYFPFVRLALARYQPYSITGKELSRVMLADYIQLPPMREARVVVGGASARIMVTGPAPASPSGDTPPSTMMEATLERKTGTDPDLGWIPEGNPVALESNTQATQTWSGSVPLSASGGNRRIVIREYEIIKADSDAKGADHRLVYADAIEI